MNIHLKYVYFWEYIAWTLSDLPVSPFYSPNKKQELLPLVNTNIILMARNPFFPKELF